MTIYNENAVPILFRGADQKIGLSPEAHATVEQAKDAALEAIEANGADAYAEHYLTGESVVIHCKQLSASEAAGKVFVSVGAETLDEALKSIIGAYDLAHLHPAQESSDHLCPPDWVASTHQQLGELLADYYSCANLPIDEVL